MDGATPRSGGMLLPLRYREIAWDPEGLPCPGAAFPESALLSEGQVVKVKGRTAPGSPGALLPQNHGELFKNMPGSPPISRLRGAVPHRLPVAPRGSHWRAAFPRGLGIALFACAVGASSVGAQGDPVYDEDDPSIDNSTSSARCGLMPDAHANARRNLWDHVALWIGARS